MNTSFNDAFDIDGLGSSIIFKKGWIRKIRKTN